MQDSENPNYVAGKPCIKCGSPYRYAKYGYCVACHRVRTNKRRAEHVMNELDRELANSYYADGETIRFIKDKLMCSNKVVRQYLGLPPASEVHNVRNPNRRSYFDS